MKVDGFDLIIFDADNTLRQCTVEDQLVPTADDEWELKPNVKAVLAKIAWGSPASGGVAIGVASNQSWIAKGRVSKDMAQQLLNNMVLKATGFQPPLWAIEFCPHLAESNCKCRKPKPHMLREIMRRWGVEPNATLFVGDAVIDREAAQNAGCWFAWARDFFTLEVEPRGAIWIASRGTRAER